jgi:predicted MPP superfamily phosphohydrolase
MIFVDGLLLLGGWVGHAALMVFLLNRLYALPLPKKVLHAIRFIIGVLILTGPIALLLVGGWRLSAFEPRTPGDLALLAYLALCGLIGFVALPALTLRRNLQPGPAVLLSNHTRDIDIAARLGYKPIGHSKYSLLAGLPGNEVFRVDFAERTLELPSLPAAWDGLTVLHLSDLHFCGSPDRVFYEHVFDRCRDWEPDLVAITGDILDSKRLHHWIIPLLGRLRWRLAAFAILGNHDSWYEPDRVRRRLRRLGMHVVGNTWQQITVRGEPLVVVGHEGPWFRPEPDLSNCPAEGFRLCLSHTPDHIRWAQRHGIDLMLAGHVHGGQIRFPLVGSVFVPSLYGRRYDCGTFEATPTTLHVSRGLGGQQPLRYNCKPEVTLLVLKASRRGAESAQEDTLRLSTAAR